MQKRAVVIHVHSEEYGSLAYGLFDSEEQASEYASERKFKSWGYEYIYVVRVSPGVVPIPVKVTCSQHPDDGKVFPSFEDYNHSDMARMDCWGSHVVTEIKE